MSEYHAIVGKFTTESFQDFYSAHLYATNSSEPNRAIFEGTETANKYVATDNVNSPSHYVQGNIECIDAMESCSSAAEFCGYLRLCAMKYIWRLNDKGDVIENLKKAQWYLRRLEEFLDDHEADKSAC